VEYELILVRYGELALKGNVIRKQFENSLINNIKKTLNTKQVLNKIKKDWGRIYVYTSQINESIPILQKVFGITSVSPAVQTKGDMDAVSKIAVNISKEALAGEKSFAIRATRTGEHEFTSQDVAVKIGNDIVKATKASVDLTNPDFELFIEIRNDNAFLYTEKIRGTGGLPLGTQGIALALIDSPKSILAAWYLMRRGCKIVFVNIKEFNTDALNSFISNWYADSNIFTVDRGRNLYENLNKIASERNCNAIVTGHILYDNPQNELFDINLLKKHIKLPILYPLIAMEKNEINKKCKEIGIAI